MDVSAAILAIVASVNPIAAQSQDTTWVDEPRPQIAPEAIEAFNSLWRSGKRDGACLIGAVEEEEGRRLAAVHLVTSAAYPDRCTGFSRYIGAVLLVRKPEEGEDPGTRACELLRGHPEWATAGIVVGIDRGLEMLRDGTVVERPAQPEAWFCTWRRDEPERLKAEPPPDR